MWAGRDLQEIQHLVDMSAAAERGAPTPLPYPSTTPSEHPAQYTPGGPYPLSAMSGLPSESDATYSGDDYSNSDPEDDIDNEMYNIPSFPLGPPSAGHRQSVKEHPHISNAGGDGPLVRVRSPPIINVGTPQLGVSSLDAHFNIGMTIDSQQSGAAGRRHPMRQDSVTSTTSSARHRSRRANDGPRMPTPMPASIPPAPSRSTTGQSELSTVSTSLLGRAGDSATAGNIMAAPEIQVRTTAIIYVAFVI